MAAFKPLAMLCRTIGVVLGFVFPAFASFKALESKSPECAAQWLTYWVVFSLFTVLEYVADRLVSGMPFYYILKLGFVLWLQLPQTKGATTLYMSFIQPYVKQHEERIDLALEEGMRRGGSTLKSLTTQGFAVFRGGNSSSHGSIELPEDRP